jgi:archaellum biogenesis protein FlaJ (TadC family)
MAAATSILVTRRRIDRLMLFLTTLVAIVSGATSLITNNLLYLSQIAIPALLWFQLRRKIPSDGIRTDTIEGSPHTILLLVWLSLCLALAMLMIALDYLLMGHKLHDPVQSYHGVAFVIHFAVMLMGVAMIERDKKRVTNHVVDNQADEQQGSDRPF